MTKGTVPKKLTVTVTADILLTLSSWWCLVVVVLMVGGLKSFSCETQTWVKLRFGFGFDSMNSHLFQTCTLKKNFL